MSQQINLLNPQLLTTRDWVGVPMLIGVLAGSVLLMIALYGWSSYRAAGLAREHEAVTAQLATLKTQLERAMQAQAPRAPSQALADKLAQAEAALQNRREVLAILEGGSIGNVQGFSGYMQAFARQNLPGLWLSSFAIDGAAHRISLSGKALQPDLVPRYIAALGQEPLLKGREFSALQMDSVVPPSPAAASGKAPEPANAAAVIDFKLQSVEKGVPAVAPTAGGRP